MKNEKIEAIKEENKKQAIKRAEPTPEELEEAKAMFDAASMPVDFTDEDFKLAPQELDIRNLSDANFKQVMFRLISMNTTLQRQNALLLVDLERLLMLLLQSHGVKPENIADKIDELVEKLQKTTKDVKLN